MSQKCSIEVNPEFSLLALRSEEGDLYFLRVSSSLSAPLVASAIVLFAELSFQRALGFTPLNTAQKALQRYVTRFPLPIVVTRDDFFQSAIDFASVFPGFLCSRPMLVMFEGEEALDAGGVTREFLQEMAAEFCNSERHPYFVAAPGSTVVSVNPKLTGDPAKNLNVFRAVGRLVAWALMRGATFPVPFSQGVLKAMLSQSVTLADLVMDMPELYESKIQYIIEHNMDSDEAKELELTFTEENEDGAVIPLSRNGDKKPVTEENKLKYIMLLCEYHLYVRTKRYLDEIRAGFRNVAGTHLDKVLNTDVLRMLLCGDKRIDVEALIKSIVVNQPEGMDPEIINNFFTFLRSLDTEDLSLFLKFVTGTSQAPAAGFDSLEPRISVTVVPIPPELESPPLPEAHTCFNQFVLPHYESAAVLNARVLYALRECSEGFGLL